MPGVVFVIVFFCLKVNQNNLLKPQVSVCLSPFNFEKNYFLNLYAPIPSAITATANTIPPKKEPPLKPIKRIIKIKKDKKLNTFWCWLWFIFWLRLSFGNDFGFRFYWCVWINLIKNIPVENSINLLNCDLFLLNWFKKKINKKW